MVAKFGIASAPRSQYQISHLSPIPERVYALFQLFYTWHFGQK
jgi:hypothetical protein